jgi:ferrochelatase
MPKTDVDAILLIGFGGPESPEQIRPFLDRVLKGRPVAAARYEEVVRHYEALGGRSPYNDLTKRQAEALRILLLERGFSLPVIVGLRNMPPFINEALNVLIDCGAKHVFGFILSAFRCEASWERYQREVTAAYNSIRGAVPAIVYPAPWHRQTKFIEAQTALVQEALARFDQNERAVVELIFTAHSIPVSMASSSPYVEQLHETAARVAQVAGIARWSIAYQSRSPQEPWLEPDICSALAVNSQPKLVVPLGFICDHVEVLYDLDVEAAAMARAAGIRMERASTVGDHPRFIELIAELAMTHDSIPS